MLSCDSFMPPTPPECEQLPTAAYCPQAAFVLHRSVHWGFGRLARACLESLNVRRPLHWSLGSRLVSEVKQSWCVGCLLTPSWNVEFLCEASSKGTEVSWMLDSNKQKLRAKGCTRAKSGSLPGILTLQTEICRNPRAETVTRRLQWQVMVQCRDLQSWQK